MAAPPGLPAVAVADYVECPETCASDGRWSRRLISEGL